MQNAELTRKLFNAISEEDIDAVKDIITQNKNINLNASHPDKTGIYTPLIASIMVGCEDILLYLLKNGGRVDVADENNKMPLSYAAESATSISLMRHILLYHPNVNHRDNHGKTAVYYAAVKNLPIFNLVRLYGADVTIPANDGKTALYVVLANHYANTSHNQNTACQLFYFSLLSLNMTDTETFLRTYSNKVRSDWVLDCNQNYIGVTADRFEKIRLLQMACSPSTPLGYYLHGLKSEVAFQKRSAMQSNLEKLMKVTHYNQYIEEQNKPVQPGVFNTYAVTGAPSTTESSLKELDEEKRLSSKQGNKNNTLI